jgi:hypothetical protein
MKNFTGFRINDWRNILVEKINIVESIKENKSGSSNFKIKLYCDVIRGILCYILLDSYNEDVGILTQDIPTVAFMLKQKNKDLTNISRVGVIDFLGHDISDVLGTSFFTTSKAELELVESNYKYVVELLKQKYPREYEALYNNGTEVNKTMMKEIQPESYENEVVPEVSVTPIPQAPIADVHPYDVVHEHTTASGSEV